LWSNSDQVLSKDLMTLLVTTNQICSLSDAKRGNGRTGRFELSPSHLVEQTLPSGRFEKQSSWEISLQAGIAIDLL